VDGRGPFVTPRVGICSNWLTDGSLFVGRDLHYKLQCPRKIMPAPRVICEHKYELVSKFRANTGREPATTVDNR